MKIAEILLKNIKENMEELEKLLNSMSDEWNYEDMVYRFYHTSFKVYHVQWNTHEIVNALRKLVPEDTELNPYFQRIFEDGAKKEKFEMSHNSSWLEHTRPMLEAFFHAKYFLEMAVKYGKKYDEVPQVLDSGLAGLLYLFNLR